MGLFAAIKNTGLPLAKGAFNIAKNNPAKSITGIGGLYGGITSDSESATGVFNDTLRGAGIGLGLYGGARAGIKLGGMGLNKIKSNLSYEGLGETTYKRMKELGKLGYSTAKDTVKTGYKTGVSGFKAARFAFENPGTVAAAGVGIGAIAYGLNRSEKSPTMEGVKLEANFNEQQNAAALLQSNQYTQTNIGTTNQMSNRYAKAFQQSTVGLTQGMHRGRH